MTDSPKLNLRQKLIQVYTEIDHVEKAGRNSKQNYSFVRAADVLRAVRSAFAKLGIYAEPNYELLGTYDIKTNSGGIMHTATVKAIIRLLDADSDEILTISGLGDGADGGDKGIYKAQTGATKNALRNGSLLPDEADPEADETVDNSTQDAPPNAHEAIQAAQRPATAQKAKPATQRPVAVQETLLPPPPPPVPAEKQNQGPAVAPTTTREPGDEDESGLPTEVEMIEYRKQFSELGDALKKDGKLTTSKGVPINRKLLVFLLSITKASEAKNISKAGWDNFFARVEKAKVGTLGLVGFAQLVNKANGIEEKQ
jgi:ERF superfamily